VAEHLQHLQAKRPSEKRPSEKSPYEKMMVRKENLDEEILRVDWPEKIDQK
jgi:hypothetical protein